METRSYTVTAITDYDAFLAAEDLWNGLLSHSLTDHVSLTFDWFKAWWRGFGEGKRLSILVVRQGDEAVAIAPLMLYVGNYRGFPARTVGFIQNENTPRSDLIIARDREESVRAVIAYLKAAQQLWDVVDLKNIPFDSPNFRPIEQAFLSEGIALGIKEGLHSPYIPVTGDWETFYNGRSKKFRKVMRNKLNRMAREGDMLEIVEHADFRPEIMDTLFALSKKSWKAKCRRDMGSTAENRVFFTELSRAAEKKKWLAVWELRINGVPAAYEYHLRYRDTVYALRADYDESYVEFSPGSLLDYTVVKDTFSRPVKEYDLCGSNDFYKKNWTSFVREHRRLLAYSPRFYGRLLHGIEFKMLATLKKYRMIRQLRLFLRGA